MLHPAGPRRAEAEDISAHSALPNILFCTTKLRYVNGVLNVWSVSWHPLSIRLDERLRTDLEQEATARGIPLSQLIRDLLETGARVRAETVSAGTVRVLPATSLRRLPPGRF